MRFNNPNIQIMIEIEEYATTREKEARESGLIFKAADFINRVEHTRLTTHLDLRQAFEYERKGIK